MAELESRLTRDLFKAVESRGAFVIVIAGGNVHQTPSLPDRKVVWRGVESWLEAKRYDRAVTTGQRLTGRKLQNSYVLRMNRQETEWTLSDPDELTVFARFAPLDATALLEVLDVCSTVVRRTDVEARVSRDSTVPCQTGPDGERYFDEAIDCSFPDPLSGDGSHYLEATQANIDRQVELHGECYVVQCTDGVERIVANERVVVWRARETQVESPAGDQQV